MTCLLHPDADGPPLRASIQNLSAHGVAFITGRWFPVDTVVPVRLFNQEATVCIQATFRVTRARTMAGGEYFIAGELDRVLEPAELLPFLL
jgi:hypothetical protein